MRCLFEEQAKWFGVRSICMLYFRKSYTNFIGCWYLTLIFVYITQIKSLLCVKLI